MSLGPPRKGASRQEVAEHLAKLVYNEVMLCHHYKVSWRSRAGVTGILQPFNVPKTLTIDIDGGADPSNGDPRPMDFGGG